MLISRCDWCGAMVIAYARYTTFQMAHVAVSRDLFRRIFMMVEDLQSKQAAPCRTRACNKARQSATGGV